MPHSQLQDNFRVTKLVTILVAISLITVVWGVISMPVTFQQAFFLIGFNAIALLLLILVNRSFMVYYLVSTFAVITVWRLSALSHLYITAWILTVAMLLKFLNYIILAYQSIKYNERSATASHQTTSFEWQLLFIRLFIGFDLIPHFCEKLLAGAAIRHLDVQDFVNLHVPHAYLMVMIAGLIELGGAFAISCGFMTRIGSLGLAIYLMVATVLGGHFLDGFIWASKGGGWEYPVFWTVLILSFAVFGAGDFSIDRWLKDHYKLPKWILFLMGGRPSYGPIED